MARLLIVVVAGLMLGTSVVPAAPVPPDLQEPSCYLHEDGVKITGLLTRVERPAGKTVLTFHPDVGGEAKAPGEGEVVEVTARGVSLTRYGGGLTLYPPPCLLKLPTQVFDRWDAGYDVPDGGTVFRGMRTSSRPEWVDVPAGRFRATPVHEVRAMNGAEEERVTYWYAPGVGEVKEVSGTHLRVLKSFTPGKDRAP